MNSNKLLIAVVLICITPLLIMSSNNSVDIVSGSELKTTIIKTKTVESDLINTSTNRSVSNTDEDLNQIKAIIK